MKKNNKPYLFMLIGVILILVAIGYVQPFTSTGIQSITRCEQTETEIICPAGLNNADATSGSDTNYIFYLDPKSDDLKLTGCKLDFSWISSDSVSEYNGVTMPILSSKLSPYSSNTYENTLYYCTGNWNQPLGVSSSASVRSWSMTGNRKVIFYKEQPISINLESPSEILVPENVGELTGSVEEDLLLENKNIVSDINSTFENKNSTGYLALILGFILLGIGIIKVLK